MTCLWATCFELPCICCCDARPTHFHVQAPHRAINRWLISWSLFGCGKIYWPLYFIVGNIFATENILTIYCFIHLNEWEDMNTVFTTRYGNMNNFCYLLNILFLIYIQSIRLPINPKLTNLWILFVSPVGVDWKIEIFALPWNNHRSNGFVIFCVIRIWFFHHNATSRTTMTLIQNIYTNINANAILLKHILIKIVSVVASFVDQLL